jgi:hypothetical protein
MGVVKDVLQTLGLFLGVAVAMVGFSKTLYELRASRKQRAEELLWKRINTAKELLDDIHKHELAKFAVRMLDWCGGECEYETGKLGSRQTVAYADVLAALKANEAASLGEKDIYIRDCFDWFFYRIDRIEHYIRRTLIDFDDVKGVFKVYARQIARDRQVYEDFLDFHGYELAKDFFKRYPS